MGLGPLIAVAGRQLAPGRVSGWTWGAVAVATNYTDALVRAGATPVVITPGVSVEVLAPFAGLVLLGGPDVDPALYGEPPHKTVYGVDAPADRFEAELVLAAIEGGLPVLAICRGMQVLNVALGGTLVQHLPDLGETVVHGNPEAGPGAGSDHDVSVAADSLVAAALGTTRTSVRSHHHQAVGRLAEGTVATAWADDGVVEGLELDRSDGWVVAVQWHPEMTAATDPVQQRLFNAFVAATPTNSG
jgi:putative glutamine amidotransferase